MMTSFYIPILYLLLFGAGFEGNTIKPLEIQTSVCASDKKAFVPYKDLSISSCSNADKCSDVTEDQTLYTDTTNIYCNGIVTRSIQSCMTGATPESNSNICNFNTQPTVWLKIVTDDYGHLLSTFVSTPGNWQPVWSVYYEDCDDLIPMFGYGPNATRCSDGDNIPESHIVNIKYFQGGEKRTVFYVSVTARGMIDNPVFTLSAHTEAFCNSCIGNDACVPETTFEITERSSGRPLDDVQFCQGEEVTLYFQFEYNKNKINDWIQALIPDFGEGWDVLSLKTLSTIHNFDLWIEPDDEECAPLVQQVLPLLCTYTDQTGRLRLCNSKCRNCPCSPPLKAGSPLPAGWYYLSNGGAGCDNTCNPNTRYGHPGSQEGLYIELEIKLRARVFQDINECSKNRNLQITLYTFTDAITGCWNSGDPICNMDVAQVGPAWELDCSPPVLPVFQNVFLEENGFFSQNIYTNDGTPTPIYVQPLANPALPGMKAYVFENGSGQITDTLLNFSTDTIIAEYIIWASDPDQYCHVDIKDTLRVTVLPLKRLFNQEIVICDDTCTFLRAGLPDTMLVSQKTFWFSGQTTDTIRACFADSTTYRAIIVDADNRYYMSDYRIVPGKSPEGYLESNEILCGDSIVNLFVSAADTTLGDMSYKLFLCRDTLFEEVAIDTVSFVYPFDLKNQEEIYCFGMVAYADGCPSDTLIKYVQNPNIIIGMPCDDLDPETINDIYDENCLCKGEIINSVKEYDEEAFVVFPNPTLFSFSVLAKTPATEFSFDVYNTFGQRISVLPTKIENGYEVNTLSLAAGVYFIFIRHNHEIHKYKLIKG
jgi:hypothetical protein